MSKQVTFHNSTFPDRTLNKIKESIAQRWLPARLLYESIGQANRWMKYAHAWAPLHQENDIAALYQSSYETILSELGAEKFHYLSIGCGDGVKDAFFLSTAASKNLTPDVTLMDVSSSLLLHASHRLDRWNPECWVVDFDSQPTIADLSIKLGEQPLVISCLGMLPTLGHEQLLPYLSSIVRTGDQLILSANLSPSDHDEDKKNILTQYNNSDAHIWYAGALLELGLEQKDFSLECSVESIEGMTGAYRIVTHATLQRKIELQVYGEIFPLEKGGRLEVFRSERWSSSALCQRLKELNLHVFHKSESVNGQEGVYGITKLTGSSH